MAFDVDQIDDVIHGRVRLGIMAYLVRNEVADFSELKRVLKTTQGNLSVHLRKLEEAGYVRIEKGYLGRKPRTQVQLVAKGRKAFNAYLDEMTRLIDSAR
jgi:DNA-binding MarR family transcriptional regulator